MLFLLLYTYVILFDMKSCCFSVAEIVLHVWAACIAIDEITLVRENV